jgi:hypothetical protein
MIAVLVIPTGVGAAIGGNAGDGNPVAKLLASCCDTLITHPNVVNASDINEMPENVLYVEGSMLDRFLRGEIELERVRTYNRILVVANPPLTNETINAVSASRATIGAHVEILQLTEPLKMVARIEQGIRAGGELDGVAQLLLDVGKLDFNALAIHTPIEVSPDVALAYYRHGGINPWGGIEAKLSKIVSEKLGKPVAHAPLENTSPDDEELYFVFKRDPVVPRIAAEAISTCYLHCVLKGLHRAPRIGRGLSWRDVDVLISPYKCWGPPHEACMANRIPVMAVRENTICGPVQTPEHTVVENYLEAAGLLMSMRAGVQPASVRHPFAKTKVL